MNKKNLWLNLKAYRFDNLVPFHLWEKVHEVFGGLDASTNAFAGKISRKFAWTQAYALEAITEYKKFIYLAVVSDFNVTPSKVIDQVWHEHLLFNKAYREFCNEVINYTLDHNPELVQTEEGLANFNTQYLDTLDLYKKEFGTDPPPPIWSITKFTENTMVISEYQLKKKKRNELSNSSYAGDTPLFLYFTSFDNENLAEDFPEFSGFGGGNSGGAGADGSWESSSTDTGSCSASSCSSSCGGGGD